MKNRKGAGPSPAAIAIIALSCALALSVIAAVITGVAVKKQTLKSAEKGKEVICIDGCDIPRYDAEGDEVFAVVSPVGYNSVERITQAPRLDTLDGKRIALVGGSFMASTTHFELKRCIEEKYSDVTLFMFNQIGSNGPFSVYKEDYATTRTRFQQKLLDEKIDAVICGNCGCGLCTAKESGSAIAAEYVGIPSVTVGAPAFIAQIHSVGVNRGVPVLRTAEYPGAFATHTTAELKENARRTVFPQIEEALTSLITAEEVALYENDGERPYDEVIYYGDNDEVQDFFLSNNLTDGLPVIPPTDARVKEYLRFTPYAKDRLLGRNGEQGFPQAFRKCYTYTVAANAVMAGVPKELFPLCIAFTECMDGADFMQTLSSTHGWSPFAWVNGPVARQLGIDCSQGMVTEEVNRAFGRFIDLAMLNIGGYYVKENRMGTFGYMSAWAFAEDEQACIDIGWQPYHTSLGYGLEENTVTAGSALSWGNNVTPSSTDPEKIMNVIAFDITEKQQNGLGNTNPQVYRTVFITKPVAKLLAQAYPDKDSLEDALIEAARRPLRLRAYALYYANTGSRQDGGEVSFEEFYENLKDEEKQKYTEQAQLTAPPDWYKNLFGEEEIWTIATMNKGETKIIVTGDDARNKVQVMPGGGYKTVKIHLPDDWDALVAPMGYQPLANFYISAETEKAAVRVPAELPDGAYLLVSAAGQITEKSAGKLCYAEADARIIFNAGGGRQTADLDGEEFSAFAKMLSVLTAPCTVKVDGGVVSEVIIRPKATATGGTVSDISKLKYADFGTAEITFAVTLAASAAAGGATVSGASVVMSSTVGEMSLDMCGPVTADADNAQDFVTYADGRLIINTRAASGSVCKFAADAGGGKIITLTFLMKPDATIIAEYNTEG